MFECHEKQKCIHLNHRCDFKPHPACIYYNEKKGKLIAEDEDHCLEVYKQKGLIDKSANMVCDSPIHNRDTAAILSTVLNWTKYLTTRKGKYDIGVLGKSYENNVIVIEAGTTVQIQAVKCNGISECWKGVDEADCGFSTFETMFYGNLYFLNFDFKFMYKFIIY